MLFALLCIMLLCFSFVILMAKFLIDWIFFNGVAFDLDPERWIRLCQGRKERDK